MDQDPPTLGQLAARNAQQHTQQLQLAHVVHAQAQHGQNPQPPVFAPPVPPPPPQGQQPPVQQPLAAPPAAQQPPLPVLAHPGLASIPAGLSLPLTARQFAGLGFVDADTNPHLVHSAAQPPPPTNAQGDAVIARNEGRWQRDVVEQEEFFENTTDEFRELVLENKDKCVMFRLANGGKFLRAKLGELQIATYLHDILTLYDATAPMPTCIPIDETARTVGNDKYAGNPYIYAVIPDPVARARILDQHILSANMRFTAVAYEIDSNAESQVVTMYNTTMPTGGNISEQEHGLAAALYREAHKDQLVMRQIASMTQHVVNVSYPERCFLVLRHIIVRWLPHPERPLLLVLLPRKFGTRAEHKTLMTLLAENNAALSSGLVVFKRETNSGFPLKCVTCGFRTHLAYLCAKTKTEQGQSDPWWGPKGQLMADTGPALDHDAFPNETHEQYRARTQPTAARGRGRGAPNANRGFNTARGGTRGGARGGGRGRGRGAGPVPIGGNP